LAAALQPAGFGRGARPACGAPQAGPRQRTPPAFPQSPPAGRVQRVLDAAVGGNRNNHHVIPAKAGSQTGLSDVRKPCLDSRFRGNDAVVSIQSKQLQLNPTPLVIAHVGAGGHTITPLRQAPIATSKALHGPSSPPDDGP